MDEKKSNGTPISTLSILDNSCMNQKGIAYDIVKELDWSPPTYFETNKTLVDISDKSVYQLDVYVNRMVLIPLRTTPNFLNHYDEIIKLLANSIVHNSNVVHFILNEIGYKLFTYVPSYVDIIDRYTSKKSNVQRTIFGLWLGKCNEYIFDFKFDENLNMIEIPRKTIDISDSTVMINNWIFNEPNFCETTLDITDYVNNNSEGEEKEVEKEIEIVKELN